jgi:hypothetical protein
VRWWRLASVMLAGANDPAGTSAHAAASGPYRSPDSTFAKTDAATPGTTPTQPSHHAWPGAAWSRTTLPTMISRQRRTA